MQDLDDPRSWAATAPVAAARLHALARASLDAQTRQAGDAADAALRDALTALLHDGDGSGLAAAFATAPGADVHRQLWRMLAAAEARGGDGDLRTTVFALPLVVVAGLTDGAAAPVALPGVFADPDALAAPLREHGALAGNRTFALAPSLAAADALDFARLPALLGARAAGADAEPVDVKPAPIRVAGAREGVHLRFLAGVALAAPGIDLTAVGEAGKWAIPLARAIGAQLAVPGVSVLALPHAPRRLVPALQAGRALQREVSAQVFLSDALRRMRGATGEPSAVISAHRAPEAPSGGELRLSLSSPFAPRDAEGFRCPLYAEDRVGEVVQMLTTLLADCRVADVRVLPGVHADRDAATGIPLLFRADALH